MTNKTTIDIFNQHFRVFRRTDAKGIALGAPNPPDCEVLLREAIIEILEGRCSSTAD